MAEQGPTSHNTDLALKTVAFSTITLLAVLAIYKLRVLIVSLVIAITLASAITPIAEAAEKKRIPRLITVLVLLAAASMIYGLLAASLVPSIHEQWLKFNDNLPHYVSSLEAWYKKALNLAGNGPDTFTFNGDDLQALLLRLIKQTLDMTAGLVGLALNGVLILFLTGCFVVEADKIWATILRWLPSSAKERFSPMIVPLGTRMGGYVRGQVLVALTVGLFLVVGFSLLRIKYALLLGVLAGVLNVVPYIGSMIAAGCALIVAFNQTPMLAGAVLVLYAVEQWVESTILVPMFLGRHVGLHPLIVLFALLAGTSLMGIPGALISVPLASVLVFLAEEFYLKRPVAANGDGNSAEKIKQSD